jgi:hypothetical protein
MQDTLPKIEDILALETVLESAEPRADFVLRLRYSDGQVFDVDFKPYIAKGGVMSGITESSFAAVRVVHEGWAIEFPQGIDFDSDTLRWDGELARRGLTRTDVTPAE